MCDWGVYGWLAVGIEALGTARGLISNAFVYVCMVVCIYVWLWMCVFCGHSEPFRHLYVFVPEPVCDLRQCFYK